MFNFNSLFHSFARPISLCAITLSRVSIGYLHQSFIYLHFNFDSNSRSFWDVFFLPDILQNLTLVRSRRVNALLTSSITASLWDKSAKRNHNKRRQEIQERQAEQNCAKQTQQNVTKHMCYGSDKRKQCFFFFVITHLITTTSLSVKKIFIIRIFWSLPLPRSFSELLPDEISLLTCLRKWTNFCNPNVTTGVH